MSIKNLQNGQRLSKRRKLDHSDSDFSEASPEPSDARTTAQRDKVSKAPQENIRATRKSNTRNPKAKQTALAKPTVLPTGGINKSAIIALQLSDLVTEATPDYDRLRSKWTRISDQLVSLIKHIPSRPSATAAEASKSLRKNHVRIPWPQPAPTKETNYKFEFIPPKQLVVGGALAQGLSIKHEAVVDMTAIMPGEVLQDKDYLNNRVFHKATFYVACIAEAIQQNLQADFDVSFAHFHDVDLLPVIKLVPKDAKLAKFIFRVSVGVPEASIPPEKTLPTRNCLRQMKSDGSAEEDQATPFYNSAVCFTAAISANDRRIRAAMKSSPAFEETCRVGQIWLRQRGFSSSIHSGGFGADEWALICALLFENGGHQGRPLFSKQYSSLQLFKAMLQLLAGRDLQKQPMLLLGDVEFELAYSEQPVLYDGSTGVNVLYKMDTSSYQALRHHAQVSLAALNSKTRDSFDATFVMTVAAPLLQYDEIYSIKISADHFTTPTDERQSLFRLHKVLTKGLGDRVSLIEFKAPRASDWAVNQEPSHTKGNYELKVFLLINPETVNRLVDHGPSADEQEEAAEFRQFWGDKAELRRFKDGSISESLVWTQASPVTLQIMQYLVALHFKLPHSSITARTHDLTSSILGENTSDSSTLTSKDAFRLIDTTYQTLTSALHNLEGLPLPVRSISPCSAALRSTSTQHPLLPSTTTPIDMLIQFDSSTRWPDSLPAIQHTKIAFLLKLGDLLDASSKGLTTRIGLENTGSATTGHANTAFLDIISPSPSPGLSALCFRLRILHDREQHLLQTALADKSLHGAVRDSLASSLASHKRDFHAQTAHTLALRNLMTKFPPLSATVRLLKKWVSAHLLARHVPDEVLEIIAAQVFLAPLPWSVPGTSTVAFLRCLQVLARWDWSLQPLVVDLSVAQDGIAEAQRAEMQTRFLAWRKLDPGFNNVVWFVGTSLDASGTVWTAGGGGGAGAGAGNATPPRVVAGRVSALAKAAVQIIKEKGVSMDAPAWNGLFVSELGDYDFVIHIHPSVVRGTPPASRRGTGKSKALQKGAGEVTQFKNLAIAKSLDVDSIGFDAVELYLRDLEHGFGSTALFFHDRYGGTVIAGLWRPSVSAGRKEWRVRLGWSSVLVPTDKGEDGEKGDGKAMCVFNQEATLAEMMRLGEGLVSDIKLRE